ncbi:hypothetical protein RA210_U20335 [Rubrivivax sp. A210]|nr:hypothetical protein RA210_U20335 [Rubrivivax sp. A210]
MRSRPIEAVVDYVKAQTRTVAVRHRGGGLLDRQEAGRGRLRRRLPRRGRGPATGGHQGIPARLAGRALAR